MEDLIYDYLKLKYPEGPKWRDPSFKCFDEEPIELRMIVALNAFEYHVGNGGWSQLLWNCFATWRVIVDVAEEGYRITESHPQAEAIPRLRHLLENKEEEFGRLIQKAKGVDDLSWVKDVPDQSHDEPDIDWRSTFGCDSIYERRDAWLEKNEERIRSLML